MGKRLTSGRDVYTLSAVISLSLPIYVPLVVRLCPNNFVDLLLRRRTTIPGTTVKNFGFILRIISSILFKIIKTHRPKH